MFIQPIKLELITQELHLSIKSDFNTECSTGVKHCTNYWRYEEVQVGSSSMSMLTIE